MSLRTKEEIKKYRSMFIIFTALALLGMLFGLYLYRYTDYFKQYASNNNFTLGCDPHTPELLNLYYAESRFLILLFLGGFTVFAPFISIILSLYKGFMCGFGTLYFTICLENKMLSLPFFIIFVTTLTLNCVINICMAAKATTYSLSLRYTVPSVKTIFATYQTKYYILSFLLLSAFLLFVVAARYFAPLLPF